MKEDKKNPFASVELSGLEIEGMPEDAFEMVNKYGTYEIQPTAESGNEFPEIAQGLQKDKKHKEIEPKTRE